MAGNTPVGRSTTNADAKLGVEQRGDRRSIADLPTAFAVAGELRNGLIVGQLPANLDDAEQFGIVLDKGSPLTRCVSAVVDAPRADGTLARLENQWLKDAGKAPVLS